jgi:hypothetical protein
VRQAPAQRRVAETGQAEQQRQEAVLAIRWYLKGSRYLRQAS